MEYQPISGYQLNMSGQITVTIEDIDGFFYPRHCWLLVEGNLVKAAGEVRYQNADLVTLANMLLCTCLRISSIVLEEWK